MVASLQGFRDENDRHNLVITILMVVTHRESPLAGTDQWGVRSWMAGTLRLGNRRVMAGIINVGFSSLVAGTQYVGIR